MTRIIVLALLLTACAAPSPARPQDPQGPVVRTPFPEPGEADPAEPAPQKGGFQAMVGLASWSALGDLSAAGAPFPEEWFGQFDEFGFTIELSGDVVVARISDVRLSAGLELGTMTFFGSGSGVTIDGGSVEALLLRGTPNVRVAIPLRDRLAISVSLGGGIYYLDFSDTDGFGQRGTRLYDDWAPGWNTGLALDIPLDEQLELRLELESHFVEFGGLDALLPQESTVSGPILTVQVGMHLPF